MVTGIKKPERIGAMGIIQNNAKALKALMATIIKNMVEITLALKGDSRRNSNPEIRLITTIKLQTRCEGNSRSGFP